MKQLSFLFFVFLFFYIQGYSQNSYPLEVKIIKLSNGFTVWLNEDHSQPKIFGAVLVKAGAKDCPNTGIAHYFEHVMFKGTDKIGTINYEAEKVLLDSIVQKYDELAATKDELKRAAIQQEINTLSIRSADYVIPNEFDRLISRYGGSELNAGTSYDYTVYHNIFAPQYIGQWAELNSERLIDPVFRLFQSELETVYEEKNMYSDFIGSQALEKATERFFAPHPYAYPIVGSTENLKNPSLSQMKAFFDKYYVAENMGLILCGDFNSDDVSPILENTFGRIRQGEVSEKKVFPPKSFEGKETFAVKLPIPLLKAMAFCWRGVPANHPEESALRIATGLLANSNNTGYLDQLSVDGKLMGADVLNEGLNEAGMLAILAIPKLFFQSYGKAKGLVFRELERVKNGDFTDEAFNSLKLQQKRKYEKELEDIDSRAEKMLALYSEGKSWDTYLNEINAIDAITREDIVAVAKKYFTADYLEITKKTGNYPKDNLKKPEFDPIVPKNAEVESEYAKKLEEIPIRETAPRFLDFANDVKVVQLAPKVVLYATPNPVNEIFTINMEFGKGSLESNILIPMATYVSLLGTDSLSYIQFNQQLQSLGSNMSFSAETDKFIIQLSGFDMKLDETLSLVGDFLKHVKADPKKMKQVVDESKVEKRAIEKSADDLAMALLDKVRYGSRSKYLSQLSVSEMKKLKGEDLLAEFKSVIKVECDIHYCGTLPTEELASLINKNIDLEAINIASANPIYRELNPCSEPVVYFIDMPKSSQSIIFGYTPGEIKQADEFRYEASLFNSYFGGNMSSLLFQQIREFRSLAYRVLGIYKLPSYKHKDKRGQFVTMLSTQCDKTTDALEALDSLVLEMPIRTERVKIARQDLVNETNNSYPSFRERSSKIASLKHEGYTSDPNQKMLDEIAVMDINNIAEFYRQNIKGRTHAYIVVGNKKRIDMEKLSSFGTIVNVKPKEVYN